MPTTLYIPILTDWQERQIGALLASLLEKYPQDVTVADFVQVRATSPEAADAVRTAIEAAFTPAPSQ